MEVVDGNRLVIVDLNHRGDISASGKTRRVASTEGNIGIKDANGVEVKIGLNVYVRSSGAARSECGPSIPRAVKKDPEKKRECYLNTDGWPGWARC